MKIAISASGKNLEARLDQRFGRCRYYIIIDSDDMSFEVLDNENGAHGGGAGVQSAQFVVSKGIQAVITGNCGPKAMQVFSAAGVHVFTGQTGTVRDVMKKYKNYELKAAAEANTPLHNGMGGVGIGRGQGMGRGQCRGAGRREI